jgi:hypothetical protein
MAKRGRKSKAAVAAAEADGPKPVEQKLVRKLADGTIEDRKRGRQPAGVTIGYLDTAGAFVEGEPSKGKRKGKRGRPKGSKNVRKAGRPAGRKPGRRPGRPVGTQKISSVRTGGLSEIEAIVAREVSTRLARARDAAVAAISSALS